MAIFRDLLIEITFYIEGTRSSAHIASLGCRLSLHHNIRLKQVLELAIFKQSLKRHLLRIP